MFEWLTELFNADPSYMYGLLALLFILCGLGLPVPEEILLITAGFLCYQGRAEYWAMTLVSAGGILVGDVLPFLLGRQFGPRLLRLRWLRFVINRQRLAMFDRWFRKRGDLVILIARFIPGLRVVAFFTGGTMRMRWGRFLLLDLCGIALVVPTFVFLGWHFGDKIELTITWINTIENSILYVVLVLTAVFGLWYWLRRRARSRMVAGARETFVEPSQAARSDDDAVPSAGGTQASPEELIVDLPAVEDGDRHIPAQERGVDDGGESGEFRAPANADDDAGNPT